MTVGNQVNQSTSLLNNQLGAISVQLRDACQNAIRYFQGVNNLGVAGLEAIGFSNTDAQDLFNYANYMQTVAEVYYGQTSQANAFNFDNALAEARGGQ